MRYDESNYNIDSQELERLQQKYWGIRTKEIEGNEYFFRSLTRKEYNSFLSLCTNEDDSIREEDFQDMVCQSCVILPDNFDVEVEKPGIIIKLFDAIIEESGLDDFNANVLEKIDLYKVEMVDPINQISCYIKEAFPDLSIEEIENFPLDKFAWYFSRADYTLRAIKGININILDPKEYLEHQNMSEKYKQTIEQMIEEDNQNIEQNNQFHKANDEIDISSGSAADFPELAQYKAFMEGKLKFD